MPKPKLTKAESKRFDEKFVEGATIKELKQLLAEALASTRKEERERTLEEVEENLINRNLASYPKAGSQAEHNKNMKIVDQVEKEAKETISLVISKLKPIKKGSK